MINSTTISLQPAIVFWEIGKTGSGLLNWREEITHGRHSDLLQDGKLRLVIVTRSDASAGLHSIRFGDRTESVTIGRLGVEWLAQWLAQATADDGKGEVISNPDSGWADLRRQLERDLAEVGAKTGAVLPQQVRIVFLGLAKLPFLTTSDYRKSVATGGIEALYVRYSNLAAASASGCAPDQIRNLLRMFVDQEQPGNIKRKGFRSGTSSETSQVPTSLARRSSACDRMKSCARSLERKRPEPLAPRSRLHRAGHHCREPVRQSAGAANSGWKHAWNAAGGNLARRYRSLLPLSVQARLLGRASGLEADSDMRPIGFTRL